jgi:hypothetical protein
MIAANATVEDQKIESNQRVPQQQYLDGVHLNGKLYRQGNLNEFHTTFSTQHNQPFWMDC